MESWGLTLFDHLSAQDDQRHERVVERVAVDFLDIGGACASQLANVHAHRAPDGADPIRGALNIKELPGKPGSSREL